MKNSHMRIGITASVKAGQNLFVPLRNGTHRKLARNSYPLITFDNDLYRVCVMLSHRVLQHLSLHLIVILFISLTNFEPHEDVVFRLFVLAVL